MGEPREALWDSIASDAAGGETATSLAEKYGYTKSGMYVLLASPKMQSRLEVMAERIANAARLSRTKMALAQPELVDAEIETALGRRQVFDDKGEPALDSTGAPIFEWISPPALRMTARHYLLDKLMPTVNVSLVHERSEVRHDVAVELRTALQSLTQLAPQLPQDIRNSRYVLEGRAAIPSALEDAG